MIKTIMMIMVNRKRRQLEFGKLKTTPYLRKTNVLVFSFLRTENTAKKPYSYHPKS